MTRYPKRLIEVDLPIKRISAHSRREKSIRHGHISTLHIWWARRPLAACRAVICAALWPDPADDLCPPDFREAAREAMVKWARNQLDLVSAESYPRFIAIQKESATLRDPLELRGALLDFIADFANWDNSTVKEYLDTSRALTRSAHEALGAAPGTRPLVVDPFAGGGSIPLEALRVGADAFASDLNPIPVLLNKVVLEYIPKYGQRLADEVRKWGTWIKQEAEKELAEFYPRDPDGTTPIAYLWARTIRCEGPGCGVSIPLMRSTLLSVREGRQAFVRLAVDRSRNEITSKVVLGKCAATDIRSTVSRGKPTCLACGYTTPLENVKRQFRARSGGTADARLMAVALSNGSFRDPMRSDLGAVAGAELRLRSRERQWNGNLSFVPKEDTSHYHTFVNRASVYGLATWEDFYTIRQRLTLATLCDLVSSLDLSSINDEGLERAVRTLLAFGVDRGADYWSSLATWAGDFVAHTFGRQALPFVWDFAEVNPFAAASGSFSGAIDWISRVIERESISAGQIGHAARGSAAEQLLPDDSAAAVVTDPPYYYAIQYADLSDFFYVWLRRSLHGAYPDLLSSSETPKEDEAIVQSPGDEYASHGKNRDHYERIMSKALSASRRVVVPSGIGVIVFANATTAGWEALLNSTISQGWAITASWPIDTERPGRVISSGRSVLASSIHLVCRPREDVDGTLRTADIGDWRDVLTELPRRIHEWMPRLADEGVVGADAIFACLGPALEIFSRYARVEKASGEVVTLREYLEQVWAAVAKEALAQVFKDADTAGFEPDSRLTAMWLWTLNGGATNDDASPTNEEEADDEEQAKGKSAKAKGGFVLEYDAARKIAQGLGANLEDLGHVVEVSGESARLLPVSERTQHLFGKEQADTPTGGRKKKAAQMDLFGELTKGGADDTAWSEKTVKKVGETTLDRVHQAMILFAANRGEALKRFLIEDGAGRDQRFWRLSQALSALYPPSTSEKRWVDGVLARKKGLGL